MELSGNNILKKDKVLSIRVVPEDAELLDSIAAKNKMSISKYVRKLIKKDLKNQNSGKIPLLVALKKSDHQQIQTKANQLEIKPSRYLKKLVKDDINPNRETGLSAGDPQLQERYNKLEKNHQELSERYEELTKKHNQLLSDNNSLKEELEEQKTKISDLKDQKNEALKDLYFLMEFFQKNAKTLQKANRDFLTKNRQNFVSITDKLKEVNA